MLINNLFKKYKSDLITQVFRAYSKAEPLNIRDNKHTYTECQEHQSPEVAVIVKFFTHRVLHQMEHHVRQKEPEDG